MSAAFGDSTSFVFLTYPAVPLEEQDAAKNLEFALLSLQSSAREFNAAVSLFDLADHKRSELRAERDKDSEFASNYHQHLDITLGWTRMAGRIGAIILGDFVELMNEISRKVHAAPTILALINIRELNTARQSFHEYFPRAYDMRNASAHFMKPDMNFVDGPYSENGVVIDSGAIGNSVSGGSGRSFYHSFGGMIIDYELSDESTRKLRDVSDAFHRIFEPASVTLRERSQSIDHEKFFKELRQFKNIAGPDTKKK